MDALPVTARLTSRLLCGALGTLVLLGQAGAAETEPPRRAAVEGLNIELQVEALGEPRGELLANQDLALAFAITDGAGNPVRGLEPAAWLDLQAGGQEAVSCQQKVRSYVGGLLAYQPQINLSAWYILTLNDGASISVENPLLDLTYTRMLADIPLAAPGEDWALSADARRLFVTLPAAGKVAVLDTDRWRVAAEVAVGGRPVRAVLQTDGHYLWVADEAAGEVIAIDTESLAVAARIATAGGPHDLALSDDDRHLLVTSAAAGSATLIDTRALAAAATFEIGGRPVSVAYSALSGAFYLADPEAGTVVAIDRARREVVARIAAEPGLGMLRISPDGRWGFVVDRDGASVLVFDTTTNRLRHTIEVGAEPDQIAITADYAYVRPLGSDRISVIGLDTLDTAASPGVVQIPTGWQAAGAIAAPAATASAMSPLPEGGGALIANPADGMIYYYMEGMNAPMGTFRTYGRSVRAVLAADKGLKETAPGIYGSAVRLPKAGRYDIAFLLDTPRVVQCFDLVVRADGGADEAEDRLSVEYLRQPRAVVVGEPFDLRFRISAGTRPVAEETRDVRILAVRAPGVWQQRITAAALGDGEFAVPLSLPQQGLYYLYIEAPSLGVRYRELPYITLRARQHG